MENSTKNNLLIPVSIIIAGLAIAGALIFIRTHNTNTTAAVTNAVTDHPEQNMPPITSADHILGNPNAPIVLVEYADTDCPYCQAFLPTLHKIIDEYGPQGKVAWVYRHFAFHPNAPKEAEATECAAELGGNDKFWQYLELVFSKKDFTQNPYVGLDPAELPKLAASIGLDESAFKQCLDSGKYAPKVAQEYKDAVNSGAEGTPYTIITTKDSKIPITNGAIPYSSLKAAIDALLNGKS